MHIILGILGVVVTILVLLNRLQEGGIDIGWLNPFAWRRRRNFRKQYELVASYSLDSPMDVAALLMLAIAKSDGEVTKEEKELILNLFETEFKLSSSEARDLLGSSSHILGNGEDVKSNPKAVLAKSYESFSEEQKVSTINLLNQVAKIGSSNPEKERLLKSVVGLLSTSNKSKW
ncbi:TerB family tellurite resistance protein [Alteromonas flava]|uniref:tellurite resistance TerB family protein n=1 Tax=Alteromonas flava TaxID=2048003 RepID=UPI000C28A1D8|nr:TerB family tellurite resistance protein [Alteromonas flava]